MAENFKPRTTKPKAPAKGKTKPVGGTAVKAPKSTSKADALRQLREKNVEASGSLTVTATGDIVMGTLKTLEDFKQAGMIVFRKTVESILTMSTLLDMAHDKLSRDDYSALVTSLHMSDSSANQLRKITETPRIRKLFDDGTALPVSTHTLYLISTMTDEEFKSFSDKHDITPDVRVEDVRDFKRDLAAANKPPRTIEHQPQTTAQAEADAMREFHNSVPPAAMPPAEEPKDADPEEGAAEPGVNADEGVNGDLSEITVVDPATGGFPGSVSSPDIDNLSPLQRLLNAAEIIEALDANDLMGMTVEDVSAAATKLGALARLTQGLATALEENVFERS